jgi:hypothetical protein
MADHLKYRIDKKYKEKDTHIESALKSFFEKELNAKLEEDSSSSLPFLSFDFCVYNIDKKPIVPILLAEIKTDKESQSSGSWLSFHKNKNYEHCHPNTERIIKDLDAQESNKQARDFIIVFMCQLWEYKVKQAIKCNNIWFVQENAALYKKPIDKSLEVLSQNHLLEVAKKAEYENLYIVRINFK